MRGKWVDDEVYFGPDRRRRPPARRWGERRRVDSTGEPPALGALLRRLRVLILGLRSPEDLRRAQQMAAAAIAQAESHQNFACADVVRRLALALARVDYRSASARADLDARAIEAQMLV